MEQAAIADDEVLIAVPIRVGVIDQIGVIIKGIAQVGSQLVAAHVVQRLQLSPVQVHHPGKKVIEGVAVEIAVIIPGLGNNFGPAVQTGGAGAFVDIVEGAIRIRTWPIIGVSLLVPLQMVPTGKDHPPKAVDQGIKIAGG